jgi:hypothetical protein
MSACYVVSSHKGALTYQTTEAGPPRRRGVLKVVAIEEHIPTGRRAKEISSRLDM